MVRWNAEIAQPQHRLHAHRADGWIMGFRPKSVLFVICPTLLVPAPKSIVFCTFGQTMVQKHGPSLSRESALKDLQVLCGQMIQYDANNFPNREPLAENPIHPWVHCSSEWQ